MAEAEASFRAALAINPRAVPVYNALAQHYLSQNAHQAARAAIESSLRLEPEQAGLREALQQLPPPRDAMPALSP